MPATVTTKPTYAVPNSPARVIFTPASGNANFIRVWCTSAPEGTSIRDAIDADKLNRTLVFRGAPGAGNPWRHTFEKGGAFALTLQEYEQGNSWGGGYENDPRGAQSETKLGAEQALTLYVAQRLTQTVGVSPDTATLVLHVVNGTVRPTSEAIHGEQTPAIIDPSSDKAAAAAKESAVQAAVDLLANDTVVGIGGSIDAQIVFGCMAAFAAHAANATHHSAADSVNAAAALTAQIDLTATQPAAMASVINRGRQLFALHMQNADEDDPTPGAVPHHDDGGVFIDNASQLLPITADAGDPATIYAALADWVRAHELHRVAALHESSDVTSTLTLTARALANVHRQFLEAITEAISPPPGQTSGATTLITHAGFTET